MGIGERQIREVHARAANWASSLVPRPDTAIIPRAGGLMLPRLIEALVDRRTSSETLASVASAALDELDSARSSDASLSAERELVARVLPAWIRGMEARGDQLPPSVQLQHLCLLVRVAAGSTRAHRGLSRNGPIWHALIKVLASERWSVGQFDVEIGGISRKQLLGARASDLVGISRTMLVERGTLDQCLFMHLNGLRRNALLLTEHQAMISYARIALLLEHKPELRGLAGVSWLHDPDIEAVSPHLAWTNKAFTANGGFAWRGLKTDKSSGALARSPERAKAFEVGTYQPRNGVVFWPRQPMLRWLSGFRRSLGEDDEAELAELEELISTP